MPAVNPMYIIQQIRQGKNPSQLMMGILESSAMNNPIYANLLTMAKEGRTADIEAFARNYFASQGKDFDSEFKAFKETYGLR